jgi:sortase A
MIGMRRLAALTLALALVAACGGGEAAQPATTTPPATTAPTTTVAPTTTTTTLPPLGVPAPVPEARADEPEVVLGTIEIPAIGISETMYSGITLTTLDRGPGHWPGTAMPGEWGNVVVAGHRTSKTRPFYALDKLVNGDEIVFTTPEGRFVYAVTGTEIVEPSALWITEQTYEHRATLFACHPPGSVRYRIAVYAEMVDPPAPPPPST